ncbi:MAG: hypothetical protein LBD42_09360 [Desulfovibrio sp.]|jgi:diaminopimelate epimerase|nr:hypothetical protein [Desulfovibrio sp.]
MPTFSFSKLVPGGNPTLILLEPEVAPEGLPALSSRLMDPMHIQAEQVGALYGPAQAPPSLSGTRPHLPHLQMMGGEFCVNATRCAALLLAGQGRLRRASASGGACDVLTGALTVSGMDRPVPVLTAPTQTDIETALASVSVWTEANDAGRFPSRPDSTRAAQVSSACCAARIACAAPEVRCIALRQGVTLVAMPGIRHLLVDTALHPLPDLRSSSWKEAGALWRASCGITDAPASGVVWYERRGKGYGIWPAVHVAATGSECLESACGSASLAMALMHHLTGREGWGHRKKSLSVIEIMQPSGESLRVLCAPSPSSPEEAWISGVVRLVARGTAYVSGE